MKIKIKGELQNYQIRQALFEKLHKIEEELLVRHAKNVTLYLTPTNGFGNPIYTRDPSGKDVQVIYSDGLYPCAADSYEIS